MKTIFSFGILGALCISVLLPSHYKTPQPTTTVYDTAVWMLQEFVIKNQDWDLGFSDSAEVMKARIAINEGIDVYYLQEDSLLKSKLPIDSQLVKLGRRIYPVYVGGKLKASITFDSTPKGWRPVIFDDSNIVAAYVRDRALSIAAHAMIRHIYKLVEAPFIETELILHEDTVSGTHVVPSQSIRTEFGASMPLVPLHPPNEPDHIDAKIFLPALIRHITEIGHR